MITRQHFISFGLIAFLTIGCASLGQSFPKSNEAQYLPIGAIAEVRGEQINLEVARTPQQQALGLMYRPELPDDQGMLFPFEPPRQVQFWMRNVPVALDMVFVAEGEVKAVQAEAPPCTTSTCPVYGPTDTVNYVIELRAGRAAELGITAGDPITINFVNN